MPGWWRSCRRTRPWRVVGEAGDGLEAIELVAAHRPDVTLRTCACRAATGWQPPRRIVADRSTTRVLVLTTFAEDEVVFEALRAGAQGFLLKDTRPEDLIAAVHAVASGEARLDPAVTAAVIARVRRTGPSAAHPVDQLTERERDVLRLLARGMSNAEGATVLVVSPVTVKTHVAALLAKLGVRDRVQAVVVAFESGLSSPD